MRSRMRRLGVAAGVVGVAGVLVASLSVSGSASVPMQNGVPGDFLPDSSVWTSNAEGLVMGEAPCDDGGECDVLLATEDGGRTWTEHALPDIAAPQWFSSLHAYTVDGERTWIVESTSTGRVYVTHDGTTWQRTDFGFSGSMFETAAQVGDSVYASLHVKRDGQESIEYVRAPIGTADWEAVPELRHPGAEPYSIAFGTDGSTVLLEEKFYAGSAVGPRTRLLTSDDGGVTWSQRPSACRNGAQGTNVPVIGADNAMYLFCEFSAATKLMVSNDGGESFSNLGNVPGALHDAAGYDQTLTKGGGVGDAVGCQIERSTDGGDTWKPTAIADHQMTSLVVDNLQFTDARHGTLACVLSEGRPTEGIDVYRTTDGGGTWRPLGLNTAVRTR